MKSGWRVRRAQVRLRSRVAQGLLGLAVGPDGIEAGPGADRLEIQQIRGLVQVDNVVKALESSQKKNTEALAPMNAGVARTHGSSLSMDHLDHLDQASRSAGFSGPSRAIADRPPGPPTWDDDRAWITLWRDAGPRLLEREPILTAWLTAVPRGPLPRGLAAAESRRIARNHAIDGDAGLERREMARLLAAAERTLAGVVGTSDEGELLRPGDDVEPRVGGRPRP